MQLTQTSHPFFAVCWCLLKQLFLTHSHVQNQSHVAGGAQACVDSRQHSLAVTLCHPWSFTSGSFLNRFFFFPKACFRLKWNSMGVICSVSQWLMLQCYSWCGRGWKMKTFDKRSRSSRLFFFSLFFSFLADPNSSAVLNMFALHWHRCQRCRSPLVRACLYSQN